ncbi:ABC transporter substrate-binding protein [Chitinimonas lacunae]|uniref:ABC transporter substrate-binding protein n=1 Tax=Chitinimonas lacunae TaxID=1963018 RepID=A0ABV8MV22_9NEIS
MKTQQKRIGIWTALVLTALTAQAKPLVFCSEAEPEGFDYAMFTASSTYNAASATIYNRLVEFETGGTRLVPGLAESWTVSPDGLQYTFKLRRGIKFHSTDWFKPTRTLNADDVLYSFRRQLDPKHPGARASPQGWPYAESMSMAALVASIDKLDDLTVRFTLKSPEAPFLSNLAMGFANIVSAEYAGQLEAAGQPGRINTQPIGTGPFIFKRYEKGAQIRYEANPDYWRGRQPIEKLIFAITPDPAVRAQKLKAGECNFISYPKPADMVELKRDPRLHVDTQSSLSVAYLAFNTERKPFTDKRVRQALALATDKEAISRSVFEGYAKPAHLPLPSQMWSYAKSIQPYRPDLARAKKLLAEAGYPQGFQTRIWVRIGGGGANPNSRLTAELIQADWAKIGVKAEVVALEWAELLRRTKAGEHEVTINGWASDNGDPDNFLTPNLSCVAARNGENRARWCNPKFDALLNQARVSNDTALRSKLYQQAQAIFIEEMPWITLVEPLVSVVYSKNVVGFKQNPFLNIGFSGVAVK